MGWKEAACVPVGFLQLVSGKTMRDQLSVKNPHLLDLWAGRENKDQTSQFERGQWPDSNIVWEGEKLT